MRELRDVVSYIRNKEKLFTEWGVSERFRDGDSLAVNLYGASGTGKTMAAHAVSRELGLKMICVDYADIESKYVGETSKNLSSTDVSVNQTRSVLLTLLNDYRGVIIFATNFIQNFDVAFMRRIRHHIEFHLVRNANAGTVRRNVREISHEEARRELGEEQYREAMK